MRRTARMDVNRRAEFREAPGGAGVVEMNVAQKDVPHIFGGEACPLELPGQMQEGRLRSGVEESEPIVRLHRGRGDNAWTAELPSIEDMDDHGPHCRLKLIREKGLSWAKTQWNRKKNSAVAQQFH